MNRSILSISWLNGQVKAVHARGSKPVTSWTCPTTSDRIEDFPTFLNQAIQETGYKGKDLVLVIENRNLLYHLQEAPLGRRSLVRSFVERRVEQSRFFEEAPACYGLSTPVPTKANQRFLLTLLPRDWVTAIRSASAGEGLTLRAIFAPATVLTRQIQKLSGSSGKPLLLSVDIGGSIALVVGRKEQVWFARSVALATSPAPTPPDSPSSAPVLKVVKPVSRTADRLEQELNRTRLFCQQQFESTLEDFWVLGQPARRALENVKIPPGMSLHSPEGEDNDYLLAWEASQLPPRTAGNLLSQFHSEEVSRRRMAAVAVGVGLVFSAGLSLWVNHLVYARETELQSIQSQVEESRNQHEENLQLWKAALKKQAFVSAVGTPVDPPVPSLFLRYLGGQLPESFTLGRIDLNRSTNRWLFRLEGRQGVSDADFFSTLEGFEHELTNGMFKALIVSSTRTRLFQEAPGEIRGISPSTTLAEGEKPFFVEGVIP